MDTLITAPDPISAVPAAAPVEVVPDVVPVPVVPDAAPVVAPLVDPVEAVVVAVVSDAIPVAPVVAPVVLLADPVLPEAASECCSISAQSRRIISLSSSDSVFHWLASSDSDRTVVLPSLNIARPSVVDQSLPKVPDDVPVSAIPLAVVLVCAKAPPTAS